MTGAEARAWLLARARELNVDLEVLGTSQRRLSVAARDGKPSDISLASSGGIGLRVIKDGRTGYAYSEELTPDALGWALDEAIGNAELQEPGLKASLPQGSALGQHDLLDEGLSAPLEDKKDSAIALERRISADDRVQALQGARYSETQSELELGSTRGVSGSYRSGIAMHTVGIVMRQGDSVKQGGSLDLHGGFHQLDPGRTAMEALDKVGRHLGARPLKTGRRRAILEPGVTATVLGLLQFALSGKNLAEGRSLLAGRLGEKVASELVTIVDDPDYPGGLGNRPFDDEGTIGKRLVLVERGVFRSFLHNSETAAQTGQANTGHAQRSYRSPLGVGASNLILEAGTGVELGSGVIVTDVMGVHAGANPISGDVSVQAMGLEIVDGEQVPVDNFAISFSLLGLLQRIEQVGNDPDWHPGAGGIILAPSVALGDLSFAGS